MHFNEISVFAGTPAPTILTQIQDTYLGTRPQVVDDEEMDFLHRKLILDHPVVTNRLYLNLLEGSIDAAGYQYFFGEYNHASQKYFTETVLTAALSAHDHPAWQTYINHIIEEESTPDMHWRMFARFMDECGFTMAEGPDWPGQRYSDAFMAGYVADLPYAIGYALGVEVQAGYEIAVLSKALVRHFPDQCKRTGWFDVHLEEGAEEEHAKASVELLYAVADRPDAMARARAGFMRYCDDAFVFFESVNRQIDRRAQRDRAH